MKILFPTDGSPSSLAAFAALIEHRSWFRDEAELSVLHVHAAIPYKRAAAWVGKDVIDQYHEEESEAALADARKLVAERGVAATFEKRVGDPAQEIVGVAERGGFTLIAMATHGHSALVNLVMGSVATKVLAASKVPVLFVK